MSERTHGTIIWLKAWVVFLHPVVKSRARIKRRTATHYLLVIIIISSILVILLFNLSLYAFIINRFIAFGWVVNRFCGDIGDKRSGTVVAHKFLNKLLWIYDAHNDFTIAFDSSHLGISSIRPSVKTARSSA